MNTKLRLARVEKGWSQEQLAEASGVSRSAIINAELGEKNPSRLTMLSICKALGKTLDELFWEDEQ